MVLFTKQKQSYRCRKETYSYQRGKERWGGIKWEIGIDICTLPYIEWITTKALLYSTGSSTQQSVMAYMGKESLKKKVGYMHMYNICCTVETNTTLQISDTPTQI